MGTRVCRVCKIEKDHSFLCLNPQSRLIYKDNDTGKIWNGRRCYDCFKRYVKEQSGKEPLGDRQCPVCQQDFFQKHIKQRVCSKKCYKEYKKKS